ncbi:MAG: type II secretion system protein [Armatimonadetes bacterium]|nr:type II secretion system protein [Armatimonadota bacterium]
MKPTRRCGARSGFSLIELLVVIIIMVMLLGIVVGAVRRLEVSQHRGETMGRLHAVARALSVYRADWGDVPPYNPTGEVGVPDGAGLWTLVMLDYLQSSRYLHDAGYPDPEAPWIIAGGGRVPGMDVDSEAGLLEVYNNATGGSQTAPLTPAQKYRAFAALADPAAHSTTAVTTAFADYQDDLNENWCSWMMQDPFTREWRYQPVRKTSSAWPVDNPGNGTYYRRQLSRVGTDDPSSRYLPASDTVVTWSTAFRTKQTVPAPQYNKAAWGVDIVLFADGHAAVVPAPDNSGWAPPRAELRAPRG